MSTGIGHARVVGAKLDWGAFFKGTGAKRVALATYPFQRKRYWLASTGGLGDLGAAGLTDPEHPLLAAAIEGPSSEGLLFTGRLSVQTHPRLADPRVRAARLLPATAFLQRAARGTHQGGPLA